MIRAYALASERHPYVVASGTASIVLGTADVIAQTLTNESWDARRTLALTSFGAVYYGFPCKFLYLSYTKYFKSPVTTMLFDVYVHSPLFLVPAFYMSTGVMKGATVKQAFQQLRSEWWEAVLGTAFYWTPLQFVCFRFVPQHSRIAFVALGSCVHKIWLSYISNRSNTL